jgi:hypothetical protein
MANLESRLRERKGRREIIGRIIEETSEFAQAVKEAARLEDGWLVQCIWVACCRSVVHQSYSYFEHVVA